MKTFLLVLLVFNIPLDSNYYLIYRGLYHAGSANGIAINFVDIILLILYFLWAMEALREKNHPVSWPKGTVPTLGLIAVGILSMYNAPVKKLAFYEIILLLKMYLLFFYVANNIKHQKELKIIGVALMLSLAAQSILSYVQLSHGKLYSIHYFLSSGYSRIRHTTDRVTGTLMASAHLAAFLAILLPLTLGFTVSSLKRSLKAFSFSCFVLGIIALVLTLSRGGWVSFMISFLVMMIFSMRYRVIRLNRLLIRFLIISLIFIIFSATIFSRWQDETAKKSAESRIPLIHVAFEMINEHPVIGVGLNNYYRKIVNRDFNTWSYVVHNKYLLVWSETGTIGFIFFLWFFLTVIRCGIKTSKQGKDLASLVAMCVTAGLIGHAFHMCVEAFAGHQFVLFFWFISGLLVGLQRFQQIGIHTPNFQ